MNRFSAILVLALGFSGVSHYVHAEAEQKAISNIGPEIVSLKMDGKPFPLKHWKHQKSLKNGECFRCHKSEIGKIDDWNKETAHTICIPCHDLNEKGPVGCKECHK